MSEIEECINAIAEDRNASRNTGTLLGLFFRGAPLSELRRMVLSDNEIVVCAGVWIASELGKVDAALMDALLVRLRYQEMAVRYDAINAVLLGVTDDGRALTAITDAMEDVEGGARWKATNAVSRFSRVQLAAALEYRVKRGFGSEHVVGLSWLLGPQVHDAMAVSRMIEDSSAVLRKYGVIAAARLAGVDGSYGNHAVPDEWDTAPLLLARASADDDLRKFAERILEELG